MQWADLRGKRLVVLGAGYVGGEAARQAQRAGLEVVALTRNAATAQALEADQVPCVVAELHGKQWHSRIEPEADFVVNTVSSAGGGLEGYQLSYVDGQRSLVEWTRAGQIARAVFTSATSVYPQIDGGWVDEGASSAGCTQAGQLLLEAENVLLQADAPLQKRIVLRLAGIYGPTRHMYLNQLERGETTFSGQGDTYLNLIHRDDAVRAILAALLAPELPELSIFNIADGSPALKQDIVRWLAAQCGQDPAAIIFDPQAASARRTLPDGSVPNRRVTIERAQQILDWNPTYASFREGYAPILKAT
ncbi:MAG: NAD-dependent epimerase/dehydratase family protein [Opitutales bacterium]